MGIKICVIMVPILLVATIISIMRDNALDERVLQLEQEVHLTYGMARVAQEKLNNLCTHFKTGCTEKYTRG